MLPVAHKRKVPGILTTGNGTTHTLWRAGTTWHLPAQEAWRRRWWVLPPQWQAAPVAATLAVKVMCQVMSAVHREAQLEPGSPTHVGRHHISFSTILGLLDASWWACPQTTSRQVTSGMRATRLQGAGPLRACGCSKQQQLGVPGQCSPCTPDATALGAALPSFGLQVLACCRRPQAYLPHAMPEAPSRPLNARGQPRVALIAALSMKL